MDAKYVKDSAQRRKYIVIDSDLNKRNDLSGGRLDYIIDDFAAESAKTHCAGECATIADGTTFFTPVYVEELLIFKIAVNRAWNTSMEIGVKVLVQRDLAQIHVASAYLTFVALDEDGKPRPVPEVLPETRAEERRYAKADKRRKRRLADRDQAKNS